MNPKTARWVLVLSSIASLMVALDALVVSTALTAIRRHFGASIDELWMANSPRCGSATAVGKLSIHQMANSPDAPAARCAWGVGVS